MNRLLTLLCVLACVHFGWKYYGPAEATASGNEVTTAELQALAATVAAEDVVMYTTTECVYCAQAKNWLHRYGFAYTECNMSIDRQCESEFMGHGGTGTPYLIVRGHHMSEGFDSEEFLVALQQ